MISILKNALYSRYACIALIITAVTSLTNFGHLCGDEYSQIFEFAANKLGYVNHSDLRLWEFDSQMRPSIQVWMVVAVYRFVGLFCTQVNPFVVSYIIYLLSGLLAVVSILVFTNSFISRVKPQYRDYFVILSLFTWLVLYTNPHFNSENICGHLLLLAVGLLYGRIDRPGRGLLIAVGVILGLSFSCRFQIGFSILGLMAWLLITSWKRKKIGEWVLVCISLLASILVFNTIADYFFYGHLVFSPYNYYFQNIATGTMNRASGVSPWFAYLYMVATYVPFGPIYVIATIYFIIKYPRDLLTSILATFVFFHLLIGHKEPRFMLPMLGFMPFLIMVFLDDLVIRYHGLEKHLGTIVRVLWTINIIACFSLLIPAATEIGGWWYLYNHYQKPTLLYYNASIHQKLLYYKRGNLELVNYKLGDPTPCPPGFNAVIAINGNSKEAKPNLSLVYSFFPLSLNKVMPLAIVRSIGHFDLYEVKNVESD